MKKFFVILFAVIVAVTSAARLPADSRPAIVKLEPVLRKIIEHFHENKHETKSEDSLENKAMADTVPEVIQPKEADAFRQKPTNLKAMREKVERLEKLRMDMDEEEDEDSETLISFGLDKPIKFADVKKDTEDDSGEDEDEDKDNLVPISFGFVEEAIDFNREAAEDGEDADVQVSFGLDEPIAFSAFKNNVQGNDDDAEEEESDVPIKEAENEEQSDDPDVQVSFGLAEPIDISALKNVIQEDDEDEDEEEERNSADVNEKFMAKVIDDVIHKFAEAHGLKL